jgi:LEA14-like dessication related protein
MAGLVNKAKDLVADKIAHMEKPTADLTDVDLDDISRDSVRLKSDVLINNPYDHDLPILEITYRLRCGDREITSGTVGHNGSVAANSSTAIAVGSKVPYSFLINLMRDIGADWDIDYDFDVGVKLKLPIIHSFTIPLHKKGTFKLPTLSDIF